MIDANAATKRRKKSSGALQLMQPLGGTRGTKYEVGVDNLRVIHVLTFIFFGSPRSAAFQLGVSAQFAIHPFCTSVFVNLEHSQGIECV